MTGISDHSPPPARHAWSILVFLDNEMMRCGLSGILTSLPEVAAIATCDNPVKTIEQLRTGRYDVLIVHFDMDARMVHHVRNEASDCDVKVVLVLHNADPMSAAQATATISPNGFLLQDELTSDGVAEALSRLANGEMSLPSSLAHSLLSHVGSRPGNRSRPILLTPRENQALSLLAEGLSNKQIARRLGISQNGAKRHVANVLIKLNCPNRTLAVVTALRDGLIATPGA